MEVKKILVVEDQSGPRKAFKFGLDDTLPRLAPLAQVTYVTNFDAARDAIGVKENHFDIIFLDHRLPKIDVGDLEKTDFNAFSELLANIGYGLIPEIREQQPNSVIIGTSSMSEELKRFPHKPDLTLNKMLLYSPDEELKPLLEEVVAAHDLKSIKKI